jgi:1-deoxy-D-xylulose-5-phosphate synthase
MRCIPNITIAAPRNEIELRNLMNTAQEFKSGPFVIRYPRGKGYIVDWKQPMKKVKIGKGEQLKAGKDLAVITIGTMAHSAARAIEKVERENEISIAHYDMRFLKPLDTEMLHEIASNFKQILTIEDGVINGGFGSAVLEFMADNNYKLNVKRLGINDTFVEHGTPEQLYNMLGLDIEGIAKSLLEYINIQKHKIDFELAEQHIKVKTK